MIWHALNISRSLRLSTKFAISFRIFLCIIIIPTPMLYHYYKILTIFNLKNIIIAIFWIFFFEKFKDFSQEIKKISNLRSFYLVYFYYKGGGFHRTFRWIHRWMWIHRWWIHRGTTLIRSLVYKCCKLIKMLK